MRMTTNYMERAAAFEAEAARLHSRYNRLSMARLLLFLGSIVGIVLLWNQVHYLAGLAGTLAFLAGFYRFVNWHQGIRRAARHQEHLAQVNRWEAAVVEAHDFSPFHDGAGLGSLSHPNAIDLDLFGPFSMFQYLNRASTALGRQQLGSWLSEPGSPEDIRERQQAAVEMGGRLEWRQHLQAYGMEIDDDPRQIELLSRWLSEPAFVKSTPWLVAALYIIPAWSVAAAVLWALYLPWFLGVLLYLPAVLILRKFVEQVNEAHNKTAHAERALARYARLIQHMEGQSFDSPLLSRLHSTFTVGGVKASSQIGRLSYIISQLNVRYNAFAFILNVAGLWELQYMYRLEQWKASMKAHLPGWFAAMSALEALSSYGNLLHNNPDWALPTITADTMVSGTELGHPLIHRSKRVCNDIALPTDGHIKLITGSNMAGKSTFLRTVGLNMVLAMAGAPVCARSFRLPPLRVYTSMRTQDALQESTSSFYAELKRLKFIIEDVEDMAGNRPPEVQAFFLLDEILKGTNSNDRHTGSKALIRQLIRSKGSGIIATHDLELGQLEAEANGTIENLRIEVEIRGGELHFDYKLKKGVSQSFNATLLMKRMGIRIEEEG